jgi:hypothetical protein
MPLIYYASENVGEAFSPGENTVPSVGGIYRGTGTGFSVAGLIGQMIERWMPFTESIVSRFLGPRAPTAPFDSPFDMARGESEQRPGTFPSGQRPFPYPYEIGAVSGFCPMLDQYSIAWAWAKQPSGPGVLTPIPIPWQTTYPNLQKVTG